MTGDSDKVSENPLPDEDQTIHVDLLQFIRTGRFGPVVMGMTYTELANALGCAADGYSISSSYHWGCLNVGMDDDGRANSIAVITEDVLFPAVCSTVQLRYTGEWVNLTSDAFWSQIEAIDSTLVPDSRRVGPRSEQALRLGPNALVVFRKRCCNHVAVAIQAIGEGE